MTDWAWESGVPGHRVPGKRLRQNRPVERAGIYAVLAIFEGAGLLAFEIPGQFDIGKDLYVDLVKGIRVTGETIAVQVKSGVSYKRETGYAIPCDEDDLALWAGSSVPVFGVVYDPETCKMFWVDLSTWSRDGYPSRWSVVPVDARQELSPATLDSFLDAARDSLARVRPPLLGLLADGETDQLAAVSDLLALGRHNARPLLLIRSSISHLSEEPLRAALDVLAMSATAEAHQVSARTWLDDDVRREVRQSLEFNFPETCHILKLSDHRLWPLGGLGPAISVLLRPRKFPAKHAVLKEIVKRADLPAALPAVVLLVEDAGAGGEASLERLCRSRRDLDEHLEIERLRACLQKYERLIVFDRCPEP